MLITYSSQTEVLVATPETEPELLRQYFEEGGRNIDDYDREVHVNGMAEIASQPRVWSS